MRLISIIAFLALLSVPCIAVQDNVSTGPYKVTFDLGIPKEAYKVEIADPKTKESLSGEISTNYEIKLINKTGITRQATISLTSYEIEQVIPSQDDLVKGMKYIFLQMDNMYDADASGREIDGYKGAAASGTMKTLGYELETYFAAYYPSSTTSVNIFSVYPWDEGTLQLLKTIHVEKINATT